MLKTLIVDDSAAFRGSIREVLAAHFPFIEIDEAATVGEAVRHARASKAELVFVDVRLPDGSGLDLVRDLARAIPRLAICVVTSFDLPEYRRAALDCGACHFLSKGSSTCAELIGVVDAMLASRVRALIVDHDADRRRSLVDSLSAHWPEMVVVEADNAGDGSTTATVLKPDLVLVEAPLPTDAAQLCAAVRAVNASSTIVAVSRTAASDDPSVRSFADADRAVFADDFDEEISAIVQAATSRH